MLTNLSEKVRYCLQHAEECGRRAKIEPDPALARDLLEMERGWLVLARSFQFGESLEDFIAASPTSTRFAAIWLLPVVQVAGRRGCVARLGQTTLSVQPPGLPSIKNSSVQTSSACSGTSRALKIIAQTTIFGATLGHGPETDMCSHVPAGCSSKLMATT